MRRLRTLKIAIMFVWLLALPVFVFWLGWRLCEVRNETEHCHSDCRFAQVRWLLLRYYDDHGAFPPVRYRATPDGPSHSWRVLLVPYMDVRSAEHFSDYDFSEEWNSPKNLRALGNMPEFNYFSIHVGSPIANYLAIGEGDEWPAHSPSRPLKSLLITRGTDRFLVVEYPESEIHWMEPRY